jgi:hypothetical protein
MQMRAGPASDDFTSRLCGSFVAVGPSQRSPLIGGEGLIGDQSPAPLATDLRTASLALPRVHSPDRMRELKNPPRSTPTAAPH